MSEISHSYEYTQSIPSREARYPFTGYVMVVQRLCDGVTDAIGAGVIQKGPPHKIDCPACLAKLAARDVAHDIESAFGDGDVVIPSASAASGLITDIDGWSGDE